VRGAGEWPPAITPFAQKLFPLRIASALVVGRMGGPIDLNDQLLLATDEVGEIGSDRFLPNEPEPAEKATSKPTEPALGLALLPAQVARPARFV
jgi:hypothetical protein